jgi:hypothetical protein
MGSINGVHMKGHINKDAILESYNQKAHLHKFDAVAEVINEILPEDTTEMPYADYYYLIYTIWNIIAQNEN